MKVTEKISFKENVFLNDNNYYCWFGLFLSLNMSYSRLMSSATTTTATANNNNNVKWYMKYLIYWTVDLKSSKLWSSQLWTQFKQWRIEAWKNQDFSRVWTRDLAIPVQRSNQLSDWVEYHNWENIGNWVSDFKSAKPVAQMFAIGQVK